MTARARALRLAFIAGVLALVARGAAAQAAPPADTSPDAQKIAVCDDCPKKRVGRAFLAVTTVNGLYEIANLVRGQATARITPETWWANMKRGWEWDLDDFTVNQIGHPYQGNNYFNAARANGLSFWESAALTAFGSGTWEYFGETNQASLNDLINTTLGGIALGEMFHRTAWLARKPGASGRTSRGGEILATAFDPIGGVSRMLNGDWSKPLVKPRDMVPPAVNASGFTGALWRGSNTADAPTGWYPFLEADLRYGDFAPKASEKPYDAFAVRLGFGGGNPVSEAKVRGRLFGRKVKSAELMIAQAYQYNANPAYQFGAQSFEGIVGFAGQPGARTGLSLSIAGGATILGAVDSIPLTGKVDQPDDPNAPQGVSTGPRYYDYGPGGHAGARFAFEHAGRQIADVTWDLHQLKSLDGVRANHLLLQYRADLVVPVSRRFGVGVTGEYFDRHTHYLTGEKRRFRFPQLRVGLTWSAR